MRFAGKRSRQTGWEERAESLAPTLVFGLASFCVKTARTPSKRNLEVEGRLCGGFGGRLYVWSDETEAKS
jgi:hypothetical protein